MNIQRLLPGGSLLRSVATHNDKLWSLFTDKRKFRIIGCLWSFGPRYRLAHSRLSKAESMSKGHGV